MALDAYGTVLNFTEPHFIATMAEICARQRLDADAALLWKRFLRASYLMRAENHHQPVYRSYIDAWRLQFERVFKQMRLPGDAGAAARQFREALAAAEAFPDAAPAIDALRRRYPVALVSNADDDFLGEALGRNGLEFDYILTSEQARAIKPSREIFDILAAMMQLPNDQILYAGDNPIPDVLGPVNAGMKSAWVNRLGLRKPRGIPQPHLRVRDLAELARTLVPSATEPTSSLRKPPANPGTRKRARR